MFTPWRSTAAYAAVVTTGSAAVGALVETAWLLASGSRSDWGTLLLFTPYEAVFLPVVFVALAVARKVCAPLPRWKAVVTDSAVYTLTLLVTAFVVSLSGGVAEAADAPFVVAILAMFNLQLPAAYLLSGWASGRLTLAVRIPRRAPGAVRTEG